MKFPRPIFVLCCFLPLALAGCAPSGPPVPPSASPPGGEPAASPAAISLPDGTGGTLLLTSPARRMAVFGASNVEIAFATGCGGKIVLRDKYSDYPPEAAAIPATEGFRPPVGPIIEAETDLVVFSFGEPALINSLRGHGLRVATLNPATLEEVIRSIEWMGTACGQAGRGADIAASMRARLAALRERLRDAPRPRVFYEMDPGMKGLPWTVGPGAFPHDLLVSAHAVNIFADVRRPWMDVTFEAIFERDPDIIVLADSESVNNPQSIELVKRRTGWDKLRAMKTGRVVTVPTALVTRPGPRMLDGLEALARAIHPERFAGEK
ncbi:MAG: Vitamin B12-binding protein [Myxococcota bacterium]|nr:Vitamin B12-binding protein [Myxococcota bacterium]